MQISENWPRTIWATVPQLAEILLKVALSIINHQSIKSVIFLTQLHSISEYCRILNTPHHPRLCSNWLSTFPSSFSREGVEWEGSHNWNNLWPLCLNPALIRSHKKVQTDKQWSTKHTYKTKDRVTRTLLKTGGALRCSGRVGASLVRE